jgi:aminopeptidase N
VFSLEIATNFGNTVISCSPLKSKKDKDSKLQSFLFEDTEQIPVYILCFVVGDFVTLEGTLNSKSGQIPIAVAFPSIYETALVKPLGKEMLSITTLVLTFLENYFDQPLMFAKMDIVAVPFMILQGMENLSCCFIHIPKMDPSDERLKNFDWLQKTIIHELVHQWIGNHVGLSIEIKEGIAMYLERTLHEKIFNKAAKKAPRQKQKTGQPLSLKSPAKASQGYHTLAHCLLKKKKSL